MPAPSRRRLGPLLYLAVLPAPASAAPYAALSGAPGATNGWLALIALSIALAASLGALAALRQAAAAARRQARAEDGRLRDFGASLTDAVREMAIFAAGQSDAAEECRAHAARANAAANRIIAGVIDAEARITRAAQRAEQGLASGSDTLQIASEGFAPVAALARDLPDCVTAAVHASADRAASGLAARFEACADRWEALADERHHPAAPPVALSQPTTLERPDAEPAFERLEALSRLLDLFSSALPDPAALGASTAAATAALDRLEKVTTAVPASLAALAATSDVLRHQTAESAAVVALAAAHAETLGDIAGGMAHHAAAWPPLAEALQTAITPHAAPANPDPALAAPFAELLGEAAAITEALRAEWIARRAQQTHESQSTERLHQAARAAADAASLLEQTTKLLPSHMAELGHATGTWEIRLATTVAALQQKALGGLQTINECALSELAPRVAASATAHDRLCDAANALSAAAFSSIHDIETTATRQTAGMAERSAALMANLQAHATDALYRVVDAGNLAQTSAEHRPAPDDSAVKAMLCTETLQRICERQTRVLVETERLLAFIEARERPAAADNALTETMLCEIRQLRDHLGYHSIDRNDPALMASMASINESMQQVQTALARVAAADAGQDQAGRAVLLALEDVKAALQPPPARSLSAAENTSDLVAQTCSASSALLRAAESAALGAEGAPLRHEDAVRTPLLLRDIDAAIRKLQGAATAVALAGDIALSAACHKAA